ncbi:MAG: helix-turn-helix domain-containing protein [Clostridia bacterium]|nr:helix-turn-helix domain-containing protein [Clostridia bacterium]
MNNIKDLRNRAGLKQHELAQLIGVHQTAVSQWEKGRTEPDAKTLKKLSEIFGVTIGTVLGYENETISNDGKIPVLGYVRAGTPVEAVEDVIDYIDFKGEVSSDYFGLVIRGNSMEPRICDGDVVIVKKQSFIESGEVAVILVNAMEATVKKVIKKGTGITLVPFNKDYKEMYFSAEDISRLPVTIIGKVVELRGKV